MKKHSEEFRLIGIAQVAAMLDVSTKTLRRMIKDRQIPAFKVGGQWRIRESQLRKWIQERENNELDSNKIPQLE